MRYIDDPVNWIAAILRIQGHGMMLLATLGK
jgi:hypothetical protein